MKVCTGTGGTGIHVPKLPKCPVPVLMSYRSYRSVRCRYWCHTELTEVSGTGNTGGIYRRYASVRTVPNKPLVFLNFLYKNEKRQLWVRPIEWLNLNFASCVVHQTRSLDVLVPCFIYNTWYGVCELNLRYGCSYPGSQMLRKVVRACSISYPHEGCRSVTPLDAARVNTQFTNFTEGPSRVLVS